ncbi:MAG: amino acid adenylation domain-containing protein [Cyanobacteria bacterium J06649_4]
MMKKAETESESIRQDSAAVDELAGEFAYAVGPVCHVELPERPAAALADIVERRGQGEFVYIEADGREIVQTYQQVWKRATQVLAGLRASGLQPGMPIILLLSQNQDFTPAFWACLMGGFVAVPLGQRLERLRYVSEMLPLAFILTDASLAASVEGLRQRLLLIERLFSFGQATHFYKPESSEPALYLSSSGTTGRAKLVTFDAQTLSYRLLGNSISKLDGQPKQPTDRSTEQAAKVSLGWLSPSSIGGLRRNIPKSDKTTHLATEAVLENPTVWLDQVQKHRVTHTGVTNFFLAMLIEQLENTSQRWDLSSIQRLTIGAEMIVPRTVRRAIALLKNHQLSPDILYPAYGLSECGVIARAGRIPLRLADISKHEEISVKIGTPALNHAIRIVDSQNTLLAEGVIGQIQAKGPTMAAGYLQNPEQTKALFTEDGWLNTGDLGFLRQGCLTVTGRKKDVIIINALNIHSTEIEQIVDRVPGIVSGYTAACGVRQSDSNTDELLICFHPDAFESVHLAALINEIRQQVTAQLGVNPAHVVALEKSEIPRTGTGKLQRAVLKQRFEQGQLETQVSYARSLTQAAISKRYAEPQTSLERTLADIWAQILKVKKVGRYDNFFELGGHSLLATQMLSRIRAAYAVEITLRELFQTPTVTELAAAVERSQQSSNGSFSNSSATQSVAASTAILPINRDQPLVLSSSQQRLWLLEQIDPGNVAYNMSKALRLTGPLNQVALAQALSTLIQRHEALRTTFSVDKGQPVQVIQSARPVSLPLIDVSTLPAAEQEKTIYNKVLEFSQRPFDLQQGPLIRVELLKLQAQAHIFAISIHHIVFDGWSFGLFFRELSILYAALMDDSVALDTASNEQKSHILPPLPIQYADFAHWQQQWLSSQAFQNQLTYWKNHLKDAPAVLPLPTDFPRPAVQSYKGDVFYQTLPAHLTKQLHQLSRQEGTTLFMTLLSAFKLLCYRLTNQSRITVGSPVAGRNRAEVEPLLGFFVGNLVLHTDLSGNPTARELLRRVKQVALDAYTYQEVPFEKLLEALQPPRDLSHTPLFQVWFNMLTLEGNQLELPEIDAQLFRTGKMSAKFDLSLYVRETDRGLRVDWVYNTALFGADTVQFMSRCFQTLLENMAAEPDQSIETLPVLDTGEFGSDNHDASTTTVKNTFVSFEKEEIEQSIPARFAKQVREHSSRIAVKTPRYEWTYQTLDEQSDRIAAELMAQFGAKAVRIALLFEQDAPMVAAILGILKAGKTYVPLDPSYPKHRLAYVLTDAQVSGVLVNEQTVELGQWLSLSERESLTTNAETEESPTSEISLLNIEQLPAVSATPPVILPSRDNAIAPDALAYILYTSGSTGQPKGVMQSHRNLLHFIRAYTNNLHIGPQDRLTLLSSYSFDAAIMDIFAALLNGATLYPIDVRHLGFEQLAHWLTQEKMTIYHSTPTLYRYFMDALAASNADLREIRLVVLGGEAVTKQDVERYRQHFSDQAIFVNGFGPSESTVTLQQFITAQTPVSLDNVPVGYPVPETEIYLLNEAGQDTQLYGEIAICSEHVALGYWQREDLNQIAFGPDPDGNSSRSNRRLYRTGDIGRRRADGSIEFLGRKDSQIKLRGFRIELGEIEAVLNQHPQVRSAVVIGDGGKASVGANNQCERLVAYLVSDGDLNATALRRHVQRQLPDYMVPSAFVFLDALPLTPSGKVDRRSLPDPDTSYERSVETELVLPRTPAEKQLAAIWQDLLKQEKVSIDDNFFELGGHSLLATQAVSRIRALLGVEIPLRSLFESPTIARLAAYLDDLEATSTAATDSIAKRERQRVKRSTLA